MSALQWFYTELCASPVKTPFLQEVIMEVATVWLVREEACLKRISESGAKIKTLPYLPNSNERNDFTTAVYQQLIANKVELQCIATQVEAVKQRHSDPVGTCRPRLWALSAWRCRT